MQTEVLSRVAAYRDSDINTRRSDWSLAESSCLLADQLTNMLLMVVIMCAVGGKTWSILPCLVSEDMMESTISNTWIQRGKQSRTRESRDWFPLFLSSPFMLTNSPELSAYI